MLSGGPTWIEGGLHGAIRMRVCGCSWDPTFATFQMFALEAQGEAFVVF
jgi:hypothetical protein